MEGHVPELTDDDPLVRRATDSLGRLSPRATDRILQALGANKVPEPPEGKEGWHFVDGEWCPPEYFG